MSAGERNTLYFYRRKANYLVPSAVDWRLCSVSGGYVWRMGYQSGEYWSEFKKNNEFRKATVTLGKEVVSPASIWRSHAKRVP